MSCCYHSERIYYNCHLRQCILFVVDYWSHVPQFVPAFTYAHSYIDPSHTDTGLGCMTCFVQYNSGYDLAEGWQTLASWDLPSFLFLGSLWLHSVKKFSLASPRMSDYVELRWAVSVTAPKAKRTSRATHVHEVILDHTVPADTLSGHRDHPS